MFFGRSVLNLMVDLKNRTTSTVAMRAAFGLWLLAGEPGGVRATFSQCTCTGSAR